MTQKLFCSKKVLLKVFQLVADHVSISNRLAKFCEFGRENFLTFLKARKILILFGGCKMNIVNVFSENFSLSKHVEHPNI